jgi:hypothetical protein
VLVEDAADDRGRDDDQQQGAAGGVDLLADPREGPHAEAASPVLLRDVDAEVTGRREGIPELARRLARLDLLLRVFRPEARADPGDGLAQQDLLLAGDHVE